LLVAEQLVGRGFLILPKLWGRVRTWITRDKKFSSALQREAVFTKKYPMIPTLQDNRAVQNESFWKHFPFRGVLASFSTRVNSLALKSIILVNKDSLTTHQFKRGMKLMDDLQNGASAYQLYDLPLTDVPTALQLTNMGSS
jgi:hypothetical protein